MKKDEHKILIVDDETEFLDLMEEILLQEGFRVSKAVNGEQALEIMKTAEPFSMIISDHKMPGMLGTEVLRFAKESFPNTPRVMITAFQDAKMMEDSINLGEVFRFLTKPIDLEHFTEVVNAGINKYDQYLLEQEQGRQKDELIHKIADALGHNPIIQKEIKTIKTEPEGGPEIQESEAHVDMFQMLAALSTALDIINPALSGHHKKTCYIAACLAEQLKFSTRDVSTIFMAAIMHDIGAIVLTDRFQLLEFEEKSPHGHAELGALLLSSFPPFAPFAPLVRYHHVRWADGEGKTFQGGSVPMSSHLIHLADRIAVLLDPDIPVFKQTDGIREKIKKNSGKAFVPEYVEGFIELSKNEAFWLDILSPNLDNILKEKSQLPDILLGLNGLEEIARFFSTIIDTRSHFTANHSSGVSASACELAALLKMTPTDCQKIKIAGYLHDLGKLAVPDSILEKPDKLDDEERQVMKSHTYHTYAILKNVAGLGEIIEWAAFHHETLKGDGYPFHKNAGELPMGCRILAVADIFTALTEDRPYRKGMNQQKTENIFSQMVEEEKVDRSVVNVLLKNFQQMNQAREAAQNNQAIGLEEFWNRSKQLAG